MATSSLVTPLAERQKRKRRALTAGSQTCGTLCASGQVLRRTQRGGNRSGLLHQFRVPHPEGCVSLRPVPKAGVEVPPSPTSHNYRPPSTALALRSYEEGYATPGRQRITSALRYAPPYGRRLACGNLLRGHGGRKEPEAQPPCPSRRFAKPRAVRRHAVFSHLSLW